MNASYDADLRTVESSPPRIAQQFAVLAVAQTASAAAAFVTNVLLARNLGPESFGQFAVFLAAAAACTVPVSWIPSLAVVLGQEDVLRHGNARRSLGAFGLAIVAMGSLVLGLLVLFRVWIIAWLPLLAETVDLLGPFVLVAGTISLGFGVLQAQGRPDLLARLIAARSVIPLALLAVVFAITDAPLRLAITVIVAGQAIAFMPFLVRFIRGIQAPILDPTWISLMLRQGSAYLLGAAQLFIVGYVDVLVIAAIATPAVVGEYGLATRIYQLLVTLAILPAVIALPVINRLRVMSRHEELSAYISRTVPQIAVAGCIVAGLVSTVGGATIPAMFGSDFARAAAPLSILMISLAVVVGRAALSPILSAHLMIFESTLAVTLGASVLVTAALLLGPAIGAVGIAAAVMLGAIAEFAFIARLASRRFSASWPGRFWLVIMAGLGLIVIPPLGLPSPPLVVALLVFALGLFIAAVRRARVFEDRDAARFGSLAGSGAMALTVRALIRSVAVSSR